MRADATRHLGLAQALFQQPRFCYSTNSLAAQNSRRSISWSFRDEPSPVGLVFSSLVMTPKLAGSEISDAGSP